ncbi:tetratricopeptide repeat protein [Candidatus Gottesmanbacteria bacterium]|nr:tetratricopeptide repeat protein [Candidatus Gottesmanbacteria bacterium]
MGKLLSFLNSQLLKKNLLYILSIITLISIAYSNSLFNGFVSDDRGILINAPSWNLAFVFSKFLTSFRLLVYLITYKFFGFQPIFYRLGNIAFHIGNTILVYGIAQKIFSKRIGILSGTLFAVHPLLVETITWISGGVYAQYSFFFLLSFYLYLVAKTKKIILVLSIVSFLLSLLSSEKASILFLVFPLYEICSGNVKKNWRIVTIFFVLSLLYMFGWFYSGRLSNRLSYLTQETQTQITIDNPLIRIPIALSSYLLLFAWPNKLTIYQSELSFTKFIFILRALLVLGYFLCAIVFFKINRKISFWFGFFIIPLIPTLIPLPLTWVVAERYAYLSVAGLCVLTALCADYGFRKHHMRQIFIILWILIIIALSIRTVVRNNDWKNEDTLWIATGKTSPSSPNTHNNLGDVYGRRGDHTRAAQEFQEAIALKPNYADAYHNLGNAYRSLGKNDEAISQYQKALDYNPTLWQSHQNIAALLYERKDLTEALKHIKVGLTIDSNNAALYTNLGVIFVALDDKENAKEAFEKALSIDPSFTQASQFLNALESGTLQYKSQ